MRLAIDATVIHGFLRERIEVADKVAERLKLSVVSAIKTAVTTKRAESEHGVVIDHAAPGKNIARSHRQRRLVAVAHVIVCHFRIETLRE